MRGEIWTMAGGGDFMEKPRPVVIVQNDLFDELDSITVCPCTSTLRDFPLFRVAVEPNEQNGLGLSFQLMVDKIGTVRKSRLGARIGRLDEDATARLGEAITLFLGLERSLGSNAPR